MCAFCRKDIYDNTSYKYLVQVKDEVEQGDEKMQELIQEMQDMGVFDSEFTLGDLMVDDEEGEPQQVKEDKKKIAEYPSVEGSESVAEYLGQYKKALLGKKSIAEDMPREAS